MAAARFQHLTLDERRSLFRMQEARLGMTEMAARLGRHRSTIYRELGRYRDADASRDSRRNMSGYYPVTAQDLARARRKRLAVARQPGWPVVLPHPKMLPRRRELSQPNAPWFLSPLAAAKPSRITDNARSNVPVSAVADPPAEAGSRVR